MPDVTLTEARFEEIASHHQSCAGLCETNTIVAALRARADCTPEDSRYGNARCAKARAALGEETKS